MRRLRAWVEFDELRKRRDALFGFAPGILKRAGRRKAEEFLDAEKFV